jgi:hypothetical protein
VDGQNPEEVSTEQLYGKFPGLDNQTLRDLEGTDEKTLDLRSPEYSEYHQKIHQTMLKKYGTMIKNAHLHLAYAYLMNNYPQNCIKHVNLLREQFGDSISGDTDFILSQYYNEAQTLLGNEEESVKKHMVSQDVDEAKTYKVFSGSQGFF